MNSLVDLQALIRQPSISANNQGLAECANILIKIMRKAGIHSSLLYLDKKVPPLIYGEVKSKKKPTGATIMFYNHYDVQPVEPVSRWNQNPFSGNIKDGKIFGRGASDDKGELITRIKAVEYILKEKGDLPCNIKFFIEGEEEIGSPHIKTYLQELKHNLGCDVIIWEFGYVDSKFRPIINLGMKGMLYVEVTAFGPLIELHSSLAALVKNPAWNIIKVLNSIWDDHYAKILVKDWYNEVRSLTKEEVSFMASQPLFDEVEFKEKYKIKQFLRGVRGNEVKHVLTDMPTCNISGIVAGYNQEGAKTVIPSFARVKIDFRLVPNMNPKLQFVRLKQHLLTKGFQDIQVKYIHGVAASRTPFFHPIVKVIKDAAERVFGGRSIINLSSAGSGPMSIMTEAVRAPCVATGCTSLFANIHSFNEFAKIDLLSKGTKYMIEIIEAVSKYSIPRF